MTLKPLCSECGGYHAATKLGMCSSPPVNSDYLGGAMWTPPVPDNRLLIEEARRLFPQDCPCRICDTGKRLTDALENTVPSAVTGEQVERAAIALMQRRPYHRRIQWERLSATTQSEYRADARLILEAAFREEDDASVPLRS